MLRPEPTHSLELCLGTVTIHLADVCMGWNLLLLLHLLLLHLLHLLYLLHLV